AELPGWLSRHPDDLGRRTVWVELLRDAGLRERFAVELAALVHAHPAHLPALVLRIEDALDRLELGAAARDLAHLRTLLRPAAPPAAPRAGRGRGGRRRWPGPSRPSPSHARKNYASPTPPSATTSPSATSPTRWKRRMTVTPEPKRRLRAPLIDTVVLAGLLAL